MTLVHQTILFLINGGVNTILLIDDDPSVNLLNKFIIEKSAIQANVGEFTNASAALEELSSGTISPELILLDINMPVMNGWEFAKSYQELPAELRSSKIFILSSSIDPQDKEKAEESPVIDGFYSKPLTVSLLQTISSQVFGN